MANFIFISRIVIKMLKRISHSLVFHIIIFLISIFILINVDLEIAFIPSEFHKAFSIIRTFCFVILLLEFLVSILIENNYLFSIFFIMDLIDLVILSTEVNFIIESIMKVIDSNIISMTKNIEKIYLSSPQIAAGIAIDKSAYKYLTLFRVISYLKIVRIAKVFEATKKLRLTYILNKKIKMRNRINNSQVEIGREKKNFFNLENNNTLIRKYNSLLNKYKADIKLEEFENSPLRQSNFSFSKSEAMKRRRTMKKSANRINQYQNKVTVKKSTKLNLDSGLRLVCNPLNLFSNSKNCLMKVSLNEKSPDLKKDKLNSLKCNMKVKIENTISNSFNEKIKKKIKKIFTFNVNIFSSKSKEERIKENKEKKPIQTKKKLNFINDLMRNHKKINLNVKLSFFNGNKDEKRNKKSTYHLFISNLLKNIELKKESLNIPIHTDNFHIKQLNQQKQNGIMVKFKLETTDLKKNKNKNLSIISNVTPKRHSIFPIKEEVFEETYAENEMKKKQNQIVSKINRKRKQNMSKSFDFIYYDTKKKVLLSKNIIDTIALNQNANKKEQNLLMSISNFKNFNVNKKPNQSIISSSIDSQEEYRNNENSIYQINNKSLYSNIKSSLRSKSKNNYKFTINSIDNNHVTGQKEIKEIRKENKKENVNSSIISLLSKNESNMIINNIVSSKVSIEETNVIKIKKMKTKTAQSKSLLSKTRSEAEDKVSNMSSDDNIDIDYNNIEGLNNSFELNDNKDNEKHKKHKKHKDKLLIESILFKHLTLKIVWLILVIIFTINIIQYEFIAGFFNTASFSHIDFCVKSFKNQVDRIDFHLNQKSCKISIAGLESTFKKCFYNLIPIEKFDLFTINDAAGKDGKPYYDYSQIKSIIYEENVLSDDTKYDFYYINMNNFKGWQRILPYIKQESKFFENVNTSLISKEYIIEQGHLVTNIYYYYEYLLIESPNFIKNNEVEYIEYLVNTKTEARIGKILNLCQSVFVCTILFLVSSQLSKDLKEKVVQPALKIIKKIRYFFNIDTLNYCDVITCDNKQDDELIFEKKLGILSCYFDMTCGKRVLNLIKAENNLMTDYKKYDFCQKGINVEGTGIVLEYINLNEVYNEEIINCLNRIYSIFHSLTYVYLGEVIDKGFSLWKRNEMLFEVHYEDYCKNIINCNQSPNRLLYLHRKKNKYMSLINLKRQSQGKDNNFETDLSFLCAVEFNSVLNLKFKNTLNTLLKYNIRLYTCLVKDDYKYGFIGSDYYLKAYLISKKLNEIKLYMKNENFTLPPIILNSESYIDLNSNLKNIVFPYDITPDTIYYKVYYSEKPDETISKLDQVKHEEEEIKENFNLNKIIQMRIQKEIVSNSDFEELVDLFFFSNHISENVNLAVKSLSKLIFHELLLCKFEKVLELLNDVILLMSREFEKVDIDYYYKFLQLKEKVKQIREGESYE